jgi:lipoprotein signal peptidase
VVDFVAFHFWPTFNVADACITVGCILLAVSLLRSAARR